VTFDLRDRAPFSPLSSRPPITWPDGARLAVWVAPNVEHYEYELSMRTDRDPWPRVPHPDVQQYSYRDYGNRQGIWRLDRLFHDFEIPPTFSLNSGVLAHYPEVADLIAASDGAVMAHGVYNSQYLHQLDAAQEREALAASIEDIALRTGKQAGGYLGPGISATVNTPDILAELGLRYQAEWVLDDQPTPIHVASGRLVSLPYTFELNDARMINDPCSAEQFADACLRQFRTLRAEGARNGRVMCVALHSFISGQPHIAAQLRDVFDEMRRYEDVWFATGDQIAAWYLEHNYDEHLRFATQLARSTESTETAESTARERERVVVSAPAAAAESGRDDDGAARFRGLDHPYPIEDPERAGPASRWPGTARLATSVVVWLDYFDLRPIDGTVQSRWMGGGPGTRPYPDYAKFAHREYGHRVGIFRLLDLLQERGVPLTVAIDSTTATSYPALLDELADKDIEWIAHGEAVTRVLSSKLTEDAERAYITGVLDALAAKLPTSPRGWLGAEYGESPRTPALLREAGVEYVLDWGSDDVPFRLRTPAGDLWAVPSLAAYDDSFALEHRKLSPTAYYGGINAAARALLSEPPTPTPRCITLNVRPWLTGQPFRTSHLDETLRRLSDDGVWFATPGQLVREVAGRRREALA
jgi:peptidoglycan/xylan/chitin deacetylase (PgdA/CDA1 family)